MSSDAPKAFVSHASEDKDRFVEKFATDLRSRGVDAWLDKWEMKPGDGLVQKIFNEGIKDASVFIVVLSKTSIEKPWVKDELDAGIIKKIDGEAKLIPVVIDECEIPMALRSTVWVKMDGESNYENGLNEVLQSIFGVYANKPNIGPRPEHFSLPQSPFYGLDNIESKVFVLACEYLMKNNQRIMNLDVVYKDKNGQYIIPKNLIENALVPLEHDGYIKIHRTLGNDQIDFELGTSALELFCQKCMNDYGEKKAQVAALILNEECLDAKNIAERSSFNLPLVENILWVFEQRGYVKLSRSISESTKIFEISPLLRRAVKMGM